MTHEHWVQFRQQAAAGLAIVGIIALWEVLCRWLAVPVWLLPSPSLIAAAFLQWQGLLPLHTLATLYAVIGGFVLAVLVGVPLAVLIVYSPFLRRVIFPFLLVLQSVPKVAIAPLLLIWVGYGLQSNIIVACVVAFFPIVINTATGLEAVSPELLELSRALDTSKLKIFWKLRLPWALPYLFSGMKVAMTLAVIGAVVGEFIGSDKGLGYLILTASSNMNTALVFAVVTVLSILGILAYYAVVLCERLLCPWYQPTNQERM
jgi:NitT/TauT family transport system permease protein